MADVTLRGSADRFPPGTSVGAYPASNWLAHLRPPSGAVVGAAAATAVVASDGSLAFSGLTEGERYYAHASVSGQDRYVAFRVTTVADGTVDQRLGALETGVGCRVYRAGNLSAPSGAITVVPLTTAEYIDDAASYAVESGKIRVKRSGLYDLAYGMNFVGGTSGARNVQVTRNGDTAAEMIRESGAVGTNARPGGAGAIRLAAGDLIGLTVYVDGGTAVTCEGTYVKDIGIDLIRIGA